jgi:hypothetical protein
MSPRTKKKRTSFTSSIIHDCSADDKRRENESGFSRKLVEAVEAKLDEDPSPLPNLTPNERAHLIVLIQTTLEVGIIFDKR